MKIVFRADASRRMGTGHVVRCLTLARELQTRGAQASFVCRDLQGSLVAMVRGSGFPVAVLASPTAQPSASDGDYPGWLGVTAVEDAVDTIEVLEERPDWMVVDHYALGVEWERRMRPHVGQLLVVDDLVDRPHQCDALLDQNFSADGDRRHVQLVPAGCRLLTGPRYALLGPEYAAHRKTQRPRDGTVRRVLVYFGGADPANMTGHALAALSAPEFRRLEVDLVIGTNHPNREALEAEAARRPATHVHGTRPHLADLMVRADVAIGGGGGTTWERMCLGLPALVVSIAENQRPTCEALGAAGFIEYVGDGRSVDATRIRDGLGPLIANRERLMAQSSLGQALVDGGGAARVTDTLLARPPLDDPYQARQALHEADAHPAAFDTFRFAWIDRCRADAVLALRNMPHVTAQMRSRQAIPAADHRAFLEAYARLDRYDFVLIDDSRDRYVGVFYVTNIGSTPEIGKYVGDLDYLGKGVALAATSRLIDFCRSRTGLRRLTSITRRDNARNIALNTRLGFTHAGTEGEFALMTLDL